MYMMGWSGLRVMFHTGVFLCDHHVSSNTCHICAYHIDLSIVKSITTTVTLDFQRGQAFFKVSVQ